MRFTRKPCSCPVCNDGRSVRGPTLQERRADAELKAELAAWEQASDEDCESLIESILVERAPAWQELASPTVAYSNDPGTIIPAWKET